VSPAVVLYEEERSDGKQQVEAVTVFTGALRSLTRCTADTFPRPLCMRFDPLFLVQFAQHFAHVRGQAPQKDGPDSLYCQPPAPAAFHMPLQRPQSPASPGSCGRRQQHE